MARFVVAVLGGSCAVGGDVGCVDCGAADVPVLPITPQRPFNVLVCFTVFSFRTNDPRINGHLATTLSLVSGT